MKIEFTTKLRTVYPEAVFGSLIVRDVSNMKKNEALEGRKRELEKSIRETYTDEDDTVRLYNTYFK